MAINIKRWLKAQVILSGLIAMLLLSGCGQNQFPAAATSAAETPIEVTPVAINEIVIYSPAPSKTMLHAHNLALGDALNACGISKNVRVIAMALPDSINVINVLDPLVKPYHLPIVTTLDFNTAIAGNAPVWHGYDVQSPDLRFVASLYDVAYGLLAVDSSIQSPSDLAGKRIAVPARPSAVRWFTEALLGDGWDILDQVTLVDIVPPNVPAAIARGEVDVVAWNIMSETPVGYQPLLPMILNGSTHWLDVDLKTVEAINTANPFKTEQTAVQLSSIIGAKGGSDQSVNLLSFRQALAAWASTPDDLITDIVQCMSQADMPFGADAAFVNKQFDWPDLKEADIHPAANVTL